MLKITKYKNGNIYDVFEIETEEGKMRINHEDNGDIYWNYVYNNNTLDNELKKELIITKEDYFIYEVFNYLFNSVKHGIKCNDYLYKKQNDNQQLFDDNKITWVSDDGCLENGSRVIIEKLDEEKIKITFKKGKVANSFIYTYNVRISNSGSRYKPLNIPFVNMYNKLKEYDFENHQIHIEEYIYSKKKIKSGKTNY